MKMQPIELRYKISEARIEALTESDNTGCCQHFWNCEYNVNNVNDMVQRISQVKADAFGPADKCNKRPLSVAKQRRSRMEEFRNDRSDI